MHKASLDIKDLFININLYDMVTRDWEVFT